MIAFSLVFGAEECIAEFCYPWVGPCGCWATSSLPQPPIPASLFSSMASLPDHCQFFQFVAQWQVTLHIPPRQPGAYPSILQSFFGGVMLPGLFKAFSVLRLIFAHQADRLSLSILQYACHAKRLVRASGFSQQQILHISVEQWIWPGTSCKCVPCPVKSLLIQGLSKLGEWDYRCCMSNCLYQKALLSLWFAVSLSYSYAFLHCPSIVKQSLFLVCPGLFCWGEVGQALVLSSLAHITVSLA